MLMIGGGIFALAYLKSFPTVYFWEREQARYRNSTISPEQRWQRTATAQILFLVLLAGGLLYMGFHWWKAPAEPQQATTIKAAVSFGSGVSLLAATAYLKLKPYFVKKPTIDHTFYVACCLPIPTQSPSKETISAQLPEYCQRVLATSQKRSPAQAA